jgi:transposase InsO family protein
MGHRRARLTHFGRLLLVHRVEEQGWTAAAAAASFGVSRATAYKWLRRHREEGDAGLENRTSRAHVLRHAVSNEVVLQVLERRRDLKFGPHRLAPLLGLPRSTVYGILRRYGVSRLRDQDRVSGIPIRYVRDKPGELVHLDIKKLARIPVGGGHQVLGRAAGRKTKRDVGYEFVHVAIDDASRVAFAQVLADERGQTTAGFLLAAGAFFADRGVRIERVLTDHGDGYRSHIFNMVRQFLGVRHKFTRPYRPQTNGKAERFIRTLVEEWAYAKPYFTNQDRLDAFGPWLDFYNHIRPHTALNGRPPMATLVNNDHGNHT